MNPQASNRTVVVVILGIVGMVGLVSCCGVGAVIVFIQRLDLDGRQSVQLPYPEGDDLAAAREACPTQLLVRIAAPQDYQEETPPAGVQEVLYPSDGLELKAWLSEDPADGQRHPAVVYLHGGFAFGSGDWAAASPFLAEGYVVMVPMLRGENGNPGFFEDQYGEVHDAVAAGEYVAKLPYVDPDKVFLAGHSAGARLVMLASMLPSKYQAAAAFSGTPDYEEWVASEFGDYAPFDKSKSEERRVRNPVAFVRSIRCPLYLFVEPSHPDVSDNRLLARKATSYGKTCQMQIVPGDHMSMVAPSVRRTIVLFKRQL